MTAHNRLNAVLDEALRGLLSMSPEVIESSESKLTEELAQSKQVDASVAAKLRLARAAALQSAQLWRGCIPEQGYTAAGPAEQGSGSTGLCVTG